MNIGRADNNDLVIDHPSISRRHARLTREGESLRLEDLASANGSWVDDQRLEPYRSSLISVGQTFWLGKVEVKYQRKNYSPVLLAVACLVAIITVAVVFLNRPSAPYAYSCISPAISIMQPDPGLRPSLLPTPEPTQVTVVSPTAPTEPISPTLELTPQAPPPGVASAYTTFAFLDLPFPYTEDRKTCQYGTLEQFQNASQRSRRGGRITSFFDHFFPIYPADPNHPYGEESLEPPEGDFILLFTGELSANDYYSGHPGYDFSTDGYGNLDTPVCAAANGTIESVVADEKIGLSVKINHVVEVAGKTYSFQTFYLHLKDDDIFAAMQQKVGQRIGVHERIGTMGTTGYSSGPHLHFEVRYDKNNDNQFRREPVDPYGFSPTIEYPDDKWAIHSNYLWVHPLTVNQVIPSGETGGLPPEEGVGGVASEGGRRPAELCALPDALPRGGSINFSVSLSPPPAQGLESIGRAISLSIFESDGQLKEQFPESIQIAIPYDEALKQYLADNEKLGIYRLDSSYQDGQVISGWRRLETQFDARKGLAIALTDRPGQFALMGEPTEDRYPPVTEITLQGPQAADGTFYDTVMVTLTAKDPPSDETIDEIIYSLDEGTTWKKYTGPFPLIPNGIPTYSSDQGEEFVMGNGQYVILASASDRVGNEERDFTPARLQVLIDPSKAPPPAESSPTPLGFIYSLIGNW